MICLTCINSERRGFTKQPYPETKNMSYGFYRGWFPCPDCHGSGILSCCDGRENLHDQPHAAD